MSKNFSCLDERIHSGEEKIVLDCDILLENTEEMKYLEGIDLDIDDIVIDGNGFSVDARGRTRIFLCTGENVAIRNIVLKNGFSRESGGAIMLEGGEVAIEDSVFCFNSCGEDGAAIHNDEGSLALRKCEFSDNNAGDFGGAINNWGDLVIIESVFNGNKANYGGVFFNAGDLNVKDSVFNANNANRGGAIYNETVIWLFLNPHLEIMLPVNAAER